MLKPHTRFISSVDSRFSDFVGIEVSRRVNVGKSFESIDGYTNIFSGESVIRNDVLFGGNLACEFKVESESPVSQTRIIGDSLARQMMKYQGGQDLAVVLALCSFDVFLRSANGYTNGPTKVIGNFIAGTSAHYFGKKNHVVFVKNDMIAEKELSNADWHHQLSFVLNHMKDWCDVNKVKSKFMMNNEGVGIFTFGRGI